CGWLVLPVWPPLLARLAFGVPAAPSRTSPRPGGTRETRTDPRDRPHPVHPARPARPPDRMLRERDMTNGHHHHHPHPGAPARGWLCTAGALVGAAGGIVMAVFPPAVGPDRYSYPFTAAGYRVAETVIVVNHLLLLAGVFGLWWAGAADTRTGQAGLLLTGLG